jgi:quaternary ammonium compound-resistance protein SugE
MAWLILILAGALEVVWATALKRSDGFTRLVPAAVTAAAMLASIGLLAVAMRDLPLGTAYAVWTGIGALGAFAVGIVALGEAATPLRLLAAALVLAGIVLFKLSEPAA